MSTNLTKYKKTELVEALQWVMTHLEGMDVDCEVAESEELDDKQKSLVALYRKTSKTIRNGITRSLQKEI